MSSTRVIQISDTHLSSTKPHFVGNWAPIRDWIEAENPALVIHTGDLTVDGAGAGAERDFAYCTGVLAEIRQDLRCVAGNHDVGLPGSALEPVTPERLDRWTRHLGPHWWFRDIPGWRLIGLDAMLFGSDTAWETEQLHWLEATMASAGERRLAWFMHQPLFLEHPEEPDTGYWSVKPGPRAALLHLVRQHRVALVATGHLHKAHDIVVDGTRYVWCPATSFVVGPGMQPEMPGRKELGAVRYDFDPSGFTCSIVALAQLRVQWIDDVVHEVYPKPDA